MVGCRSQWGRPEVTDNLVEAGNFHLQEEVLLFCYFLTLFCLLQGFEQLSILHVEVFDQHIRFTVPDQLQKQREQNGYAGNLIWTE